MRIGHTFKALLLVCMPAVAVSPQLLLEQLDIDHAALVAAENDYRSSRARGALSGDEAADYAAWVARLYRQVAEDCAALATHDIPVPEELSCPVATFIAPAPIDQAAEQTGTEKTAVLDAELRAGMGEFDEMLLVEQERIKAAAPHTSDSGGQGGGADGGGAAGGMGQQGADSTDGGSGQQGAGSGNQQRTDRTGTPRDIPDGSDDDVVARQLREAAEKETDPELKKKLWEEYRKYKEGIR